MYVCRCGAPVELPSGSIEVFTIQGEASLQLCDSCTVEVVRFVANQPTRRITMSDHNESPRFELVDDDDVDDLSLPVEADGYVSEDWLRELKRPA